MALKLVLFSPTLSDGKGGTERVVSDLANEMTRRSHVVYVVYKNKGRPAYDLDDKIIKKPYLNILELNDFVPSIDPDVYFIFYFSRHLINFYSVVHEFNLPFGMQECTNPDRLITNNWKNTDTRNISTGRNYWEREIIGSAAHRIRLTMPLYTKSFPSYIQPNVRAYPNPAFPQKSLQNIEDHSSSQKVIINIGGLKANKNLITLLKAFALLADEYPDWVIKVFGKTGEGNEPHKIEIRKFIRDCHLENRVIICGPTNDIFSEFKKSHIHAISSLSEGCPNCVLEAMATGVPSIGFADCFGTNELIRDGENGLLASPENRVRNLSKALRKLMHSTELRMKMGKKAWEDSKKFAPETIYDKWEQLFYEASEYKNDPERLFREQMAIDPEKAIHARRMREKIIKQIKGTI